jgi:hypothetical protein
VKIFGDAIFTLGTAIACQKLFLRLNSLEERARAMNAVWNGNTT